MVELIGDAFRLVSMLLIGDTVNYWGALKDTLTEEEIVARGREKLRNTCLVFAEEE
jgi:acyl dehydratase